MGDWIKPANSRSEVRRAGEVLRRSKHAEGGHLSESDALNILNNWKAAHELPLDIVFRSVMGHLDFTCHDRTIVSRRKRTESILLKLEQLPKLDLSRMQDLVGFRIVFRSDDPRQNIECVEKLTERIRNAKWEDTKPTRFANYIDDARDSGYRSQHIIFKYDSKNNPEYKNMQVELQVRTKLQHIWATAVETVGMFRRSHLKQGIGDEKWLEFFRVMSMLMQFDEDPYPDIHNDERGRLKLRLRDISHEIKADRNLKVIALQHAVLEKTFKKIEREMKGNIGYVLMTLDLGDIRIVDWGEKEAIGSSKVKLKAKIKLKSFPMDASEDATTEYGIEEKIASRDTSKYVLLAKGEDLNQLRDGFPNYFADIEEFIKIHSGYLET
tara:strand:- start:477 stop:1622 length:1146 start_codon:yes stop_codon:yes gene_type:complete